MFKYSGVVFSALASFSFLTQPAFADTKSVTWLDKNYVPCEGIGATGSGVIDVSVTFSKIAGGVKVTDLQVRTRYHHPHRPSASISFVSDQGKTAKLNLQEPWFPTIGPNDGSKYLYLPRAGSGTGSGAQTPFQMKAGALELNVSTLFPQHGGSCVSSFSNTLQLP